MVIRFTNTTHKNIKAKSGKLVTTKKDKNGHGFGLKILEDISKKYSGQFDIESKNKQFIAIITLKLE